MSDAKDKDDRIGYKRPPQRTRWKKGQTGNPRRKRTHGHETEAQFIERHLMSTFAYTAKDGETRKMTKIAGIINQLVLDALRGNTTAFKVLQKYKIFAGQSTARALSVEFEDSEYARKLTLGDRKDPSDDRT